MSDAITRKEAYLKSIGDGTSSSLKPITREEQYLAYIAGESKSFPTTPITREEAFLDKIAKNGAGGGGSGINVQPLTVTENGTWDAPEGQAYDPVIVNVAGGGENVIVSFLEGTITEINSSDVKSITTGATVGLDSLVSVSLPNLETITSSGFNGCDNLKNVNLPQLKTVSARAFRDCKALTSLSLPEVTQIGNECFAGCVSLQDIYLPKLRVLGQYMIQNSVVKSISFPEVVSPASSAFEGCELLEIVDLPKLSQFYNRMFFNCYALKTLNAPIVTQLANYTFQNCKNIERLDFPKAFNIGQSTFLNCNSLKTVILRSTTLCSLNNVNTFKNCFHFLGTADETYNPNGDKDGYIYVPSAHLENYKAATNWAQYADRFRAIEDYPEITGG